MRIILNNPEITVMKTRVAANDVKLTFSENGVDLEIELSEQNTKALGMELIRVCPVLKPEIKLEGTNDSYRLLASEIKELDNRGMQLWLREVQSDALIMFLWFMKDRDLIELVFKNMSERAAEMLLDDLTELSLSRGDPDGSKANKKNLIEARNMLQDLVKILNRLQDEGHIQ